MGAKARLLRPALPRCADGPFQCWSCCLPCLVVPMAVPPQLRALLLAVNALLRKRRYHAALAMVKGFRNGAVYGVKIRAPHALVMTFLFRSGRSTCTCCHDSCLPCAAWAWRRATFPNPGFLRQTVLMGWMSAEGRIRARPHQLLLLSFLGGLFSVCHEPLWHLVKPMDSSQNAVFKPIK
ncbi:peroxisomal membrane protein 4 isoform X5 [Panthera tigris]|uniref:peroxisomal membrane protein 4 isoform X5 n=1 Tax=Panthera tigris TaxID=9694 RepID=UPI001C6FC529|nr:peroxisomal membrane protein 4 isoform X5 [Panthera tigris]